MHDIVYEAGDVVRIGKGKVTYTVFSDQGTELDGVQIQSDNTGKLSVVEPGRLNLVVNVRTKEYWDNYEAANSEDTFTGADVIKSLHEVAALGATEESDDVYPEYYADFEKGMDPDYVRRAARSARFGFEMTLPTPEEDDEYEGGDEFPADDWGRGGYTVADAPLTPRDRHAYVRSALRGLQFAKKVAKRHAKNRVAKQSRKANRR